MQKSVPGVRLLLGLIFLIFGLNGFYTFIPVRPLHPFLQILARSGYLFFIKGVEVLAGVLLLANRAVLLALVLLGADIANIVAYHALLDHRNWAVALILSVLYAVLLWRYRMHMKELFRWRV